MPASPFDSVIYRALLHDEEVGGLFSDLAEVRAMMRVEGALAKVQGELGLIPRDSGTALHRAAAELPLDPASLTTGTEQAGIPVPSLVDAWRGAMGSTEHAQYLHWGATSQDIMDTGLVLRLAELWTIVEHRLTGLLHTLARQADTHAELPMAARTRSQLATPTSLGAVIAAWGAPLLVHLEILRDLKPRLLRVSLAGASGNSTALGDRAAELRAALSVELGLADSLVAWHGDRAGLSEFSSLLTRVCGSLGRMGEDHILAGQSEVGELGIEKGGGSSTMPQKNNPVTAEILVSLFRVCAAMDGLMTQALLHRQQRDLVAWSLEAHALPQVCMATARALTLALELAEGLRPHPAAMEVRLASGHGLVFAEAISFKLATVMPRPEAQDEVKRLCAQAVQQNRSLPQLVAQRYPQIDWATVTTAGHQLGDAPSQARAFAERARRT